MRRQVAAVALLLAVGSLTACAEYTTTGAPQETADVQDVAASPGAGEQDALAGTSWTLVDSSMDAGLEQFGITAEFSDGAIAGQAPVNRYNASFEVEGDQITFGPVASTMMAGEPVAMEAEGAYFALLSTVTGFHQAADSLTFLADEVPVMLGAKKSLIFWGMRDAAFQPWMLKKVRAAFSDQVFVELPHAGHYIQEDAPDQMVRGIVERFG